MLSKRKGGVNLGKVRLGPVNTAVVSFPFHLTINVRLANTQMQKMNNILVMDVDK